MARKRMLSPDIWNSTFDWGYKRQLVFICAVTWADDEGKGKVKDVVAQLRGHKWDIKKILDSLGEEDEVDEALIVYGSKKEFYILPGWFKTQYIQHAKVSTIPCPDNIYDIVDKTFIPKYRSLSEKYDTDTVPVTDEYDTDTVTATDKQRLNQTKPNQVKPNQNKPKAESDLVGSLKSGLAIIGNPSLARAMVMRHRDALDETKSPKDGELVQKLFRAILEACKGATGPKQILQYIWTARKADNPSGWLIQVLKNAKYYPPEGTDKEAGQTIRKWDADMEDVA